MLEGGFYRRRSHHRGTHRWVVSIYFCLLYEKKATGDLRMICVPRSLLRSHAAARRHQLVMGALGLGCTCKRILRQNDMRDGILPGVIREKPYGFVPIELHSQSRYIQSLLPLGAVHTHL